MNVVKFCLAGSLSLVFAFQLNGQQDYLQQAVDVMAFRDVDDDGVFDETSPQNPTNLLIRYFPTIPEIPEQDRPVLEFDVSSIPDNATIVSAELSFTTTSFTSPPDEIEIVGFAGDGVATPEDAATPGTSLLVFENTTLDEQSYSIDTDFITSMLEGDFVGIRFQSAGDNTNTGIRNLDTDTFFVVPLLNIVYETLPGKQYSENAVAADAFRDIEDDGIYDEPSPSNNLLVRYFPLFPDIVEQDRSVLEFDVSAIPDNAQINSAVFSFNIVSVSTPSCDVDIIGYSGNGVVTTTDAEVVGQLLASYEPMGVGLLSFPIDTDLIADNLSGNFVGIRLQSSGGDVVNTSAGSSSGNLTIVYSPGSPCSFELGDINQDNSVNLLDVGPYIDILITKVYQCEADINQDGDVNLLDVPLFVDLLSGG